MKCKSALLLLVSVAASSVTLAQGTSSLRLYDNFKGNSIDPLKWYSGWTCNPGSTECERSIQGGQLRLRVRGYGSPTSNTGTQYGTSELFFTSATVTDIQAQVTVSKATVDTCATNTGWSQAQFLLWGAFFNGGGGTPNDDVKAYLQLDHGPGVPSGVLNVGGFIGYHDQWTNFEFGTVNIGEEATVELQWDQPHHQFVARLFRPKAGIRQVQYMPYSMPDFTPAVNPYKVLSANAVPPNCIGSRPAADVEVLVQEVKTN